MVRKSMWDEETSSTHPTWDQIQDTSRITPSGPPVVSSLIEQLKAEAPHKRRRTWDDAHTALVASYRGVPLEIRTSLREIAQELDVVVGEVARAFLEYGLKCVKRGSLQLHSYPKGVRMTLYPPGKAISGWGEEPGTQKGKGESAARKKHKQDPAWRSIVSFRGVPGEVQEAVRALAQQHAVAVGEVASILLGTALQAYRAGRLVLKAVPKSDSQVTWDNP